MRIGIIGAGIGGLTLAVACQRLGWEVVVYEKANALKTIGGGVLLWPHGKRYLQWLGLDDILTPFSISIQHCKLAGVSGEIIFQENYRDFNALIGGSILPVNRSQLQQTLVSQLKPHTIQFNKTCTNVESDAARGMAEFADGTKIFADVIVGADGIHSEVRKYMLNIDTEYTGNCWWGGIIKNRDLPNLHPEDSYVAVEAGKMCMVWPCADNHFMWYLPVKMPAEELKPTHVNKQLQKICCDWRGEIQQIISAPSQQNFHLPIYDIPPQVQWVKNRVVLIGDAAHALGPILGQGASQVIEDVFVLLNFLRHVKDARSALQKYDNLRHDRYARLYELEKDATSMMITTDPEARLIFEALVPKINLATMYQELIPLVDKNACLQLAEQLKSSGQMRSATQVQCTVN